MDRTRIGHVRLRVGRLAVLGGRVSGGAGPAAWDDAAHKHGDHRRVRGERRDGLRLLRPRLLVGVVLAGDDQAARPLAGDAGHRAGVGGLGGPGRAVAGRRGAGKPRRRRLSRSSCGRRSGRSCAREHGDGAGHLVPARPGTRDTARDRSPPRSRPGAASSSRIASPSKGCARWTRFSSTRPAP